MIASGAVRSFTTVVRDLAPDRKTIPSDLFAGLTFAVVNVPQAMAHAMLAAVNPILGIYTLMLAVPVGAVFTNSVYMNVSSTAALSVAAGGVLIGYPAEQRTEALVVLVLLIGLFQLFAGLLRLGSLIRFISNSVLTGFLNGVALLIILGQLGELTGFKSEASNRMLQTVDLLLSINRIDLSTAIIGGLTLGLTAAMLLTRFRQFASILSITAATGLLAIVTLPANTLATAFTSVPTVQDIVSIPRALPEFRTPAIALVTPLLLPAFSVAVIGLIQGAGISEGTRNPNGQLPDASGDFFGQGLANIAASFVAGIPAGGSISGTALVISAGARSRWSNLFVGLFVALIVLLAAPLVERVPMPALAALVVVAGFQGLRARQAVMAWRTGKVPAAVMTVTFSATLAVPLQYAVVIGMLLSIALHILRQSSTVIVTQWVLQPGEFPLEKQPPRDLPSDQLTLLHIYGSIFFAAAKTIEAALPNVDNATNAVVAIDLRGKAELGSTFLNVLRHYAESLQRRSSKLMLIGVGPRVRDQLTRTGLIDVIGEDNVFDAKPQLGAALMDALSAAADWIVRATRNNEPPK